MKTASQLLRDAKALIDTPEKWMQGHYGEDANGESVSWANPKACKLCSYGAIKKAVNESSNTAADFISHIELAIRPVVVATGNRGVVEFNDTPGRTHDEVMTMFDKAIAAAEAAEGSAGKVAS